MNARDDEAAVSELDQAWDDAYVRNDRSALAGILADDFVATKASGETVTKAQLIDGGAAAAVTFAERALQLFGPTAVSRGRIRVVRDDQNLEQRFVRVYAKREGRWQAVAVQVYPVVDAEPASPAQPNRPVFDQVNVVVGDMPRSVDFYRRLGVEVGEWRPDWDSHHRTLGAGDGIDFDLDSAVFAQRWCQGWAAERRGPVLSFRVGSRDAVDRGYAELTGAGYRGLQPPYDAFWGARFAIVEDPDGNAVGLMSPSDPAHRRAPPDPSTFA